MKFVATKQLELMKLDANTTAILLQYIQSTSFNENHRTVAAVYLKNHIKKVYGVSILSI